MKEEGESEALEGDKFVVFGISPVQPEKCHLSIMFKHDVDKLTVLEKTV